MSKNPRAEAYTALQAGIGERISWVRELAGLNKTELSDLINVDRSMISHIEAGNRPPSIFNVIEIANRLRVSTDYILRGLLTAESDQEMAVKLAALHPELVLRMERKASDKDMGLEGGKLPTPKRRVPAD